MVQLLSKVIMIVGGKSIVSEILMLRQILGYKKRALYILPFVSIGKLNLNNGFIVTEKAQYLSKICENINLKIVALHSQSTFQNSIV